MNGPDDVPNGSSDPSPQPPSSPSALKPPRRRFSSSDLSGLELSTVGFTLVISSVFGLGIGYWVDSKWGTGPWGLAGGFLFGTAAGFIQMFQALKRANRDE